MISFKERAEFRFCEKYDAWNNVKTGRWLEKKCNDEECIYCAKRPDKHTPHKWQHMDLNEYECGRELE